MSRPVIGIIGLGKVGETLARLLYQNGYNIAAIYNRSPGKAHRIAVKVNALVVDRAADVIDRCDLTIVAVTDDAIESVAQSLVESVAQSKGIVHVSGTVSIQALQDLHIAGAMVGSVHPAFPFADVESAIKGLVGATFAIEYSHPQLRHWLSEIATTLQGYLIEIPAGKKAHYHAALVIASNYMVTLYAIAQDLLRDLTDDTDAIHQALNTLMSGTMHNLIAQGIPDALTGPLVRTDVGTIEGHLAILSENSLLCETYINLARLSYPMLRARGTDINKIEKLLRQDN